jgi:hypothetical protein
MSLRTGSLFQVPFIPLALMGSLAACTAEVHGGFTPPPAPPLIALSDTSIVFSGSVGGADPALQTINVINFGGGNLDSLTIGSVTYGAGQPVGWLAAGTAGSPPIISLQPSIAGLTAGTYAATVTLVHPSASNTPLSISVGLQVVNQPVLSLTANQFQFATTIGGPRPSAQQVSVVNSGPGSLTGITLGPIIYAPGQPTGWLTAGIPSGNAPTTLTVQPNTANLPTGTHIATFSVNAPSAVNTPVNVAVSYTLSSTAVILATPASFNLGAVAGGPSPAAVSSNVTNAGGGTLTGLNVEPIVYGLGPTNWLNAALNSTTAPATLTITPNTAGVAPGSYNATIPISSSTAGVDTIAVRVSLTVTAPPRITFSASAVNFAAIAGAVTPPPQSVLVTNGGTGTLTGLTVGTITYGPGATGWLSASLSGSLAPATLTLTPAFAGLGPGTYTAAVPITSNTAGVASASLQITATLSSAVPGGIVKLGGDNQTAFVGNLLPQALRARVLTTANLPLPGAPVTWTVNNGGSLSTTTSVTDANGEVTTTWTVGPNPGTHTVSAQTPGVPAVVFSANVQPLNSAGYPNEPAGFTQITERGFDARVEQGWTDRGGNNFSIITDGTAPRSPQNVGRATFPLGFAGGTGPILTGRDIRSGNFTSIYISFWIKLSPNWDGHTSFVNKIYHLWINGQNKVYLSAQGSNAGPLQPQVRLQGIPGPSITRNLTPNVGAVSITRGNWHRWELVVTANTVGNADGVVEWWIDGVKVGSYRDVQITSASRIWTNVDWNPTWGGTGDIVPADQFMYMDHIYISGKP